MERKKILIELPMDLYKHVAKEANREERSVRSTINILVKRGLEKGE